VFQTYIFSHVVFIDARSVSVYPYISHKFCNMLSILNNLALQKELQIFVTNNVFFGQNLKTQQQQNKQSNKKPLPEMGIEPGTSCT